MNPENNVDLPATEDAVRIGGNKGTAGQTIQKDSNNRLHWGFIDDIEIPDNSIENAKLKDKTIENNKIKDGTIISSLFADNSIENVKIKDKTIEADKIKDGTIVNSLLADNSITNAKLADKTIEADKIKDGTIVGSLMKSDIGFTTTGNISASQFIATDKFAQTGTGINSFNGLIQTPKITTLNQESEAINVANGGIVNMYQYTAEGGPVTINMKGQNGEITCEDINVNNHTGTIDFNSIDCNSLNIPLGLAKDMILNTAGIQLSGTKPNGFSGSGATITCSNIALKGLHGSVSCLCEGNLQITSSNGATPQDGDLIISNGDCLISAGNLNMTNGNATLTTGNMTLTAGNLLVSKATSESVIEGTLTLNGDLVSTGGADFIGDNTIDIIDSSSDLFCRFAPSTKTINNAGVFVSTKVGNATPPTPASAGSYTEWGLELSDAKGDAFIGRNLICSGTIYGNVEGTITEEEVDCQRITCRTATPPLSGITGMILGSGAILSNDTTGIKELTIDADTSGILCNNLSVLGVSTLAGNTTIGSGTGSGITTTIGGTSSTDILNVETTTISLGSSTGNLANIRTTIRGGITEINGNQVKIGGVPQGSNPAQGTSLEGSAGQQANNLYRNDIKYFNLVGQHISHSLAGTIQDFVILRADAERTITIAKQVGFTNTSTVFTLPDTYFFENKVASTSVAKIDFDLFFRHKSGVPDLYVRVDSEKAGAYPYNSSELKPSILVNTAFGGTGNEIRVTHSYFILGLIPGNSYSFYPKFADTTSGSAVGTLKYGGAFGQMSLKLTWLEAYLGVAGDPYAPADDY
tara:strand:- start:24 stop:2456 length:2433 start_codon:yes stop_codon:yes gene_type:complete